MGRWPVVIVDHDPAWGRYFAEICSELTNSLEVVGGLVGIEHVGSTSVPGLAAKNIIDVLIGVDALATVNARWVGVLEGLGYRYVAKHEAVLPMRRFFARYPDEAPQGAPAITIHLHVVEPETKFWHDHILFRDILRGDDSIRDQYAKLKRQLANEYSNDREGYTDAKTDFILGVMKNHPIDQNPM